VLVALFVTGWLGFAIQPCVAMDHSMDGAHAVHGNAAGDANQHCPHCPPVPGQDAGCDQGAALACGGADAPVLPAKDLKAPQPDLLALPCVIAVSHFHDAVAAAAAGPPDARPGHPPSASLQQRYCSFLK
jgi:hypothetical protein